MESNDLLGTYDALIVRFVICATQHPQINLFYNKSIFIYIVVIIMLFLYNYIVRPTRIQQNFDTTVISYFPKNLPMSSSIVCRIQSQINATIFFILFDSEFIVIFHI